MLHPGAQRSEHRIRKSPGPTGHDPLDPGSTAQRQSGHQLGAQSRHHLGASLPLAQGQYTDRMRARQNNLITVSIFRG